MRTFSETISHGMTTDIKALKARYLPYSEFSGYGELSIERNTDPSLKTADAYRWPVSAVYKFLLRRTLYSGLNGSSS